MSVGIFVPRVVFLGACVLALCSCFHPPYNNFQPDNRTYRYALEGAGIGATIGAIAGSATANAGLGAGIGAIVGGATGAAVALNKESKRSILRDLAHHDIQFIQYGDTLTLIVPTDRYFVYGTPRLNEICYPGLISVIKLLKYYPCSPVYVAAFTDDVGSQERKKKLSQAQAETMLTFLWANHIAAHHLHAEGYGDKHTIGNNHWIRGSAYNRRIEIQWMNAPGKEQCLPQPSKLINMSMK